MTQRRGNLSMWICSAACLSVGVAAAQELRVDPVVKSDPVGVLRVADVPPPAVDFPEPTAPIPAHDLEGGKPTQPFRQRSAVLVPDATLVITATGVVSMQAESLD